MDALLGKITQLAPPAESPAAAPGAHSLEIKFKPACIMPQRTKVPEWLKDQTLTLRREVRDLREAGGPGDSLVLTPVESEQWLYPLTVTPDVASGKLPDTLQLRLRWWKDEKLPEYTVKANGRSLSGQFTKEGEAGVATVETKAFFDFDPVLPVVFEVTVDKMKAACTVLPENEPFSHKFLLPVGEQYRMENVWYGIDVTSRAHGGGLISLRERGRNVDHFRGPENLIHPECEYGGHADRLRMGWDWGKLKETAMACAGIRRDGLTTRLTLDGVVDEGQGLRTSVTFMLYDALPLLVWERTFQFHKGKEPEKKDDKDEKPKEPIDDMKTIQLGFRAAWQPERKGRSGSRILCADGARLAITRPVQMDEQIRNRHWRMMDGWTLVEHPERGEYSLYLFDRHRPPNLFTWMGEHALTLEPQWPHMPVRPNEVVGFTLALTAGEIAGATTEGAWVASRAALPGGGVRGALVARLRDAVAGATATFSVGGETITAPLQSILLPGIGEARFATADFPEGRLDQPFAVDVDRIARRR